MARNSENGLEKKSGRHRGKGFITGLSEIMVDPLGAIYSHADYSLNGIGPSDKERGLDTLFGSIHKATYSEPDAEITPKDAGSRYFGETVGALAGAAGMAGLFVLGGPSAMLAVPAIAGVYSTVRAGISYIHDYVMGEKIDETRQKGTFNAGFQYGMAKVLSRKKEDQRVEMELTGRGLVNSEFRTKATSMAKGVRRNLRSNFGTFCGGVVGALYDAITFGKKSAEMTIEDGQRVNGKIKEEKFGPAYVYNAKTGARVHPSFA